MFSRIGYVKLASGGDGVKELVLTLSEAELTKIVGSEGAYMPMWGRVAISAGTLTVKSALIRRTANPKQTAHVWFDVLDYLALSELNDPWAFDTAGLLLPKFPIEGGIDIVLEVTVGGGGGDVTLITKGPNAPVGPLDIPAPFLPGTHRPTASRFIPNPNEGRIGFPGPTGDIGLGPVVR